MPSLRIDSSRRYSSLEPLIPLDASDEDQLSVASTGQIDYNSIHVGNYNDKQSELEFQNEISKLKQQSTNRFKTRWEEILDKYSLLDDEKESDEIDLVTGDIITDNGHLRSLGGSDVNGIKMAGNIWAPTYDWEGEIVRQKRNDKLQQDRKLKLKSKLKSLQLFDNQTSEPGNHDKRSYLPDNLLLLNPSPTKRTRLSPTKSSPVKGEISRDISPTRTRNSSNYVSSPVKGDFLKDISPTKGKVPTSLTKNISPLKNGRKSATDNKIQRDLFNRNLEITSSQVSESEDESDNYAPDPFYKSSPKTLKPESTKLDVCSYISSSTQFSIFDCAFDDCNYCTGNKQLYEVHLLEKHKHSLHLLGYPVQPGVVNIKPYISNREAKLLYTQFPPYFQPPSLPITENGDPIMCGLQTAGNKRCKKSFLTVEGLNEHQNGEFCSSNDQVYVCPLLGCEYTTKNEYLAWRNHFIDEKHHLDPKHRDLSNPKHRDLSNPKHRDLSNPKHRDISNPKFREPSNLDYVVQDWGSDIDLDLQSFADSVTSSDCEPYKNLDKRLKYARNSCSPENTLDESQKLGQNYRETLRILENHDSSDNSHNYLYDLEENNQLKDHREIVGEGKSVLESDNEKIDQIETSQIQKLLQIDLDDGYDSIDDLFDS